MPSAVSATFARKSYTLFLHLRRVTVAAGSTYFNAFGNLFSHGHGGQNHDRRWHGIAFHVSEPVFVSSFKSIAPGYLSCTLASTGLCTTSVRPKCATFVKILTGFVHLPVKKGYYRKTLYTSICTSSY